MGQTQITTPGSHDVAEYPDPETKHPLAADCRRCPALVDSRERISWGNGPLDADVVVVGEAPGAGTPEADRWKGGNYTGLAYTARHSGRKIRELMADLGYQENCYYTNAVKCFPSDGEGSNREPTEEEHANCRPYLEREIEEIEPRAVVATGKHATTSLLATENLELDGFVDSILDPVALPGLDTTLVPVLHPSYQAIWISRLGYSSESYLDAVRETLAAVE